MRDQEVERGSKPSKLTPVTQFPSKAIAPRDLQPLQAALPPGDQEFKRMSPWGTFLIKTTKTYDQHLHGTQCGVWSREDIIQLTVPVRACGRARGVVGLVGGRRLLTFS